MYLSMPDNCTLCPGSHPLTTHTLLYAVGSVVTHGRIFTKGSINPVLVGKDIQSSVLEPVANRPSALSQVRSWPAIGEGCAT